MKVVSDAKVFDILQALRVEYGWLIPMPGDWHVLYQKAMMKPYADVRLKATGYRAKTLTSIRNAISGEHVYLSYVL